MISKNAIQKYINRDLDDLSWIKLETKETVLRELNVIFGDRLVFKSVPYFHQLAGMLIGAYKYEFLYLYVMGVGKTKLIIDLIVNKEIQTVLVLCPNDAGVLSWEDEIEKHSDCEAIRLYGGSEKKHSIFLDLFNSYDFGKVFVIMTYPGLVALFDKLSELDIFIFADFFDCVVYDEIHKTKNPKSNTFLCCSILSDHIKNRYGLTGTIAGRSPIDLWAPFYLIDRGKTFGNDFNFYKQVFFNSTPQRGGKYFKDVFKKEYKGLISQWMKNSSLSYDLAECNVDLPKRVDQNIYYEMSEFSRNNYESTIDVARKNISNRDYKKLKNTFMALRHILSGRFKIYDEDSYCLFDDDNRRLKTLFDLIESIGDDEKIIIFVEFVISGDDICNGLDKLKIKHAKLYGKRIDHISALDSIQNGDTKVLVVNAKSGGESVNLQVARYCIFYESPLGSIARQQAEKRVYRNGQTRQTFIYDIICRGTIDEKIIEYADEGKDLLKDLMGGKVQI